MIKTGDIVEAFNFNQYLGRGMVVSFEKNGMILVETYDECRYSCAPEDLKVIDE